MNRINQIIDREIISKEQLEELKNSPFIASVTLTDDSDSGMFRDCNVYRVDIIDEGYVPVYVRR